MYLLELHGCISARLPSKISTNCNIGGMSFLMQACRQVQINSIHDTVSLSKCNVCNKQPALAVHGHYPSSRNVTWAFNVVEIHQCSKSLEQSKLHFSDNLIDSFNVKEPAAYTNELLKWSHASAFQFVGIV